MPLGTVLLEEIGFRGVVYGLSARMWGFAWATVISSVLFGLWHVQPAIGVVTSHPSFKQLNGVGVAVPVTALSSSRPSSAQRCVNCGGEAAACLRQPLYIGPPMGLATWPHMWRSRRRPARDIAIRLRAA